MSRSSSSCGHCEVVLGLPVLLEQRLRDAVHVHVGRLRREHHGDEQLERAPEAERDRGVGVLGREPVDDRPDPLLLRPDPLAGPPSRSYEATASGSARAQARPRADEVERRTAGTGELARRRRELAGLDARDRSRQLGLELGDVGVGEDRLHRRVRAARGSGRRPRPRRPRRGSTRARRRAAAAGSPVRRSPPATTRRARSSCSRRRAPGRRADGTHR